MPTAAESAVVGVPKEDHDPFEVLRSANTVLLHNLRRDEVSPELQKQLTTTGMASSSQAYFCDPYTNSYLGPQIRPKSFAMLPETLSRERDRVKCMTFMGLLPEIDHAWMTVDNVLYLWNYNTQDFTQFRELDQVIVTVALVPPKKGVFNGEVKHVLAVATTVEVVLLAVTYQGNKTGGSHKNRRVEIRPTNFRSSTDGVAMLKIAAHANGRVFMAGKDGNLYELTYSVAYGFWYSVFFMGSPSGMRKCDRLTHKSSSAGGSGGGGAVNSVLALFGLRRTDRVLVDVVVDSLRNVLYTLDMSGDIDLFDLGADGNHTTQKNNVFNLWAQASKFCSWASFSQTLPTAQMFKDPKNKFQIVSLGVVDPTESKDISLVAVSDVGLRFYLSCGFSGGSRYNFRLNMVHIRCPPPEALWQFLHQGKAAETAADASSGGAPAQPQQPQQPQQQVFQPPDGFQAKWDRQAAVAPSVYGAYSCSGVTVMAQGVGQGDRLVLITSDLVTRSKRKRELRQEEHPSMRESVTEFKGGPYGQQQPMGKVWAISERPVTVTENPENGRVRALLAKSRAPPQSEINPTLSSGARANGGGSYSSSSSSSRSVRARVSGNGSTAMVVRRPGGGGSPSISSSASSITGGMVSRIGAWRKSGLYAARPIAPAPPAVASPGGSGGFAGGLVSRDVERVLPLPELAAQPYSDRRELLCLTGAGLRVLTRLRPVDLLYDLLAQNHSEGVRLFFEDFSPDQSAAMCFSIACGLPRDVGHGITGGTTGSSTAGSGVGTVPPPPAAYGVPDQTVRARALDAALMNCKPPAFTSPGPSPPVGGGGVGGGVIMAEKLVFSALHNGLQLFIGRLLRPFWFLPVVTAPPASGSSGSKRSADGRAKSGGSSAPPSIRDLEVLRAPLESLRASIQIAFPRAVRENLAALESKEVAAAATASAQTSSATGGLIGSNGMTGARASLGGGGGALTVVSTGQQQQQQQQQQQLHQKALKREALEVHQAYRLVSRAAEAVRMAGVLARTAREFPGSNKIPWPSLDGIEFWKLVSGADEHRKVASLLADLVGPKGGLPVDARNGYARELGSACGGFFGSGDQRTFEGVELLRRAGIGAGGGNKEKLTAAEEASARQGAELLAEGAKDWRGDRALGPDGQLARACAALTELGRFEAVVDVCMNCAKNFGGGGGGGGGGGHGSSRAPSGSRHGNGVGASGGDVLALMGGVGGGLSSGSGGGRVSEWEEGVYQGGGVVSGGQREKARLECYQRVLDTVVCLLKQEKKEQQQQQRDARSAETAGSTAIVVVAEGETKTVRGEGRPSHKVQRLVARCLSYKAQELDEMLFKVLEEHDKTLLMSIRTPGVEKYLRRDPELLYRHYMLSKEYPKAVYLMDREARVPAEKGVHVRRRVDCLLKAISACHKCDLDAAQMVAPGWSLNHAKLRTLEDERDVLLVQERLLDDLLESMVPLERLSRDGRGTEGLDAELAERRRIAEAWTTGIVDPSELYGQASGVFLWEGCLRLLQCCEFDEPVIARKLIRSIIWREVPSVSRGGSKSPAQAFISGGRDRPGEVEVDDVRAELDRDGYVEGGEGGTGSGSSGAGATCIAFEDGGWFTPLLDKMSNLTLELLGRKAKFVLPVETLCLELQTIADKFTDVGGSAPPLCVVQALKRGGLSAVALLNAYEFMNRNHYPHDDSSRLRRFAVMVFLLKLAYTQGDQIPIGKPGVLLSETVPPERLERLAQDTYSGLDSLRFSSGVSPGKGGDRDLRAREEVDALKRQIDQFLESPRFLGKSSSSYSYYL